MSATRTFSTLAVVLDREDWREHDSRVTFFTESRGKVSALAKGLRKQQSKLAAHLEPITLSEVFFVQGKQSLLVAGSVPLNRYGNVRTHFGNLMTAGAVCRLTDLFSPFDVADVRVDELLQAALTTLEETRMTANERRLFLHCYAWQLMNFLGYRPDLSLCRGCQQIPDDSPMSIVASSGTLTHTRCQADDEVRGAVAVTLGAIKGLRYMLTAPLDHAARLRSTNGGLQEMVQVIEELAEERFDLPSRGAIWQ